MTSATSVIADRKTFGHLSYRVATRRQSFSLPIRRPRPPFNAQTGRGAVSFEIGGVHHHCRLLAVIRGQTDHRFGEDAFLALPLPSPV
jgi:hypothetical protein